jgi:hypothetical protein
MLHGGTKDTIMASHVGDVPEHVNRVLSAEDLA